MMPTQLPTSPEDLVVPPPYVKLLNYPVTIGVVSLMLTTTILLIAASKFDRTHGSLTISLMIVLTFAGVVTMCLFFTIPQDQTTAAVIGGLVAAFGAVMSFWLTPKNREPPD
jgi:uncharacterized membrane protein HdeD (DUF308 family)